MISEVSMSSLWVGWGGLGFISLINGLLADRLGNARTGKSRSVSLSVLIPARNEECNLKRVLPLWKTTIETFLQSQPDACLELLLLDDQSEDETRYIAKDFFFAFRNSGSLGGGNWRAARRLDRKELGLPPAAKGGTRGMVALC